MNTIVAGLAPRTPLLPMLRLLPALVLVATLPSAQLPEDAGPHLVGQRDVVVTHPLAANATVPATVYYPAVVQGPNAGADPAAGPFPLVAFLHGFFANASFYDDLSTHVASWGFVVVATQTESGFFMDVPNEAADSRALLHWAEAESALPTSFLFDMADGGPWAAYGHSNGGAGSLLLAGSEPRIESVGLLEPNYLSNAAAVNANWNGDLLVVGGEVDVVAPYLPNAKRYHDEAVNTRRKLLVEILGAGHNGSLDFPVGVSPLSHAEQHRIHRRAIGTFLRAELLDDENAHLALLGEGSVGEPYLRSSTCDDPIFWATSALAGPPHFASGLAARSNELSFAAWSLAPANLPTAFGMLSIDLSAGQIFLAAPTDASGVEEALLVVPSGLTGTQVWFQGLRLVPGVGGMLTRDAVFVLP